VARKIQPVRANVDSFEATRDGLVAIDEGVKVDARSTGVGALAPRADGRTRALRSPGGLFSRSAEGDQPA
jgi:hypothetical protein